MGKRRGKKQKATSFHGKTLDEILSGAVPEIQVQVGNDIKYTKPYSQDYPNAHQYNFQLGGEPLTKFDFDSTGEDISSLKHKMAEEKKRRLKVEKAEAEAMFDNWSSSYLKQIDEIRAKVKDMYANDDAFKTAEPMDRFTYLATMFKSFSEQHPVIMEKIAVEGAYSKKAFLKYLKKIFIYRQRISKGEIKPDSNRDEHFKRQADYGKFLYEASCRPNPNEARRTWSAIYKALKDEDDDTKEREKEVKKQFEEEDLKYQLQLKQELLSKLKSNQSEYLDLLKNINKEEPPTMVEDETKQDSEDEECTSRRVPAGRYNDIWTDSEDE